MSKLPREEISYKKLHKKLDLEKPLGIGWPKVPYPTEVVVVDEGQETFIEEQKFTLDEYDKDFCTSKRIDEELFANIFQLLDSNFLSYMFRRIDSLKRLRRNLPCDICGSFEVKDEQSFLTCQGCGISTHEECYGTAESPDGIWLCKKCIFHFESGECKFCQRRDGILKRTDTNEWCHVICALLIPGLSFCNINIRDPIDTSELVSLEGTCSICNSSSSSLITCSFEGCGVAYHASCCAEIFYCDLNNKLTYCNSHNPLKSHKRVLSKRNMFRFAGSYPEITSNVLLRKPIKLAMPIKTKYHRIVSTEPFVIEDGIEQYKDAKFNVDMIKEYWVQKRKALGFYFNDIFIFSNRLLGYN